MAQVICTSKHAKFAKQIGGVKFFNGGDVGLISEEISDEEAAEFLKTPTIFRLHEGDPVEHGEKPARGKRGQQQPPAAATTGSGAPSPGF
jgi:hypothetical protein